MAANWKIYEEQIFEKFRDEFPDADLRRNQKIRGNNSKTERQIDILVIGTVVGIEVMGAVECKFFNKKVDVKIIDGFISVLEDIGAKFGILVTNIGFSHAAKNTAASKGIRVDVVQFKDIGDYHFDWESCEACLFNEYGHHEIYWESFIREGRVANKTIELSIGHCSFCNTTHIKCLKCLCVIGIWDGDYGEIQECNCQRGFIVERHYDNSGVDEEIVYLQTKSKKIELKIGSKR